MSTQGGAGGATDDGVTSAIFDFADTVGAHELQRGDVASALTRLLAAPALSRLLEAAMDADVYGPATSDDLGSAEALAALAPLRRLSTALSSPLRIVVELLGQIVGVVDPPSEAQWRAFAARVGRSPQAEERLLDALARTPQGHRWRARAENLALTDPHALHPTSPYRRSEGHVRSSADDSIVDAVMTSRTYASVRVDENVLDPANALLRNHYAGRPRVVALVDANVAEHHGGRLHAYFAHHGIRLEQVVYRAMEIDKGIRTVERMLGDLKAHEVARDESVLVVGGGVLTDVAGLACALYHRGTPYVMLSTSLVAGIDAGPSPRTCCDGFGYKNLFGAYHPPVLAITDRSFFSTLREGWLRHGVAELVKMAVVKDAELFRMLEDVGTELVRSRFGTLPGAAGPSATAPAAQRILAAGIRSYVAAEYGNLYETHQCRPHAYGHTWSPGFEIPAGLLHGHAVAIGMGLGAHLAHRAGWIADRECHRILRLMSDFGLSLWHDVLDDTDLVWAAQRRMIEKRGGQLAAPLPRGGIGQCGYLDAPSRAELVAALASYREVVATYPRAGAGIEPLCVDVGLEDPATVAVSEVAPADVPIRRDARPAA